MKKRLHRRDVLWAAVAVCSFGLGLWISPRLQYGTTSPGSGNSTLSELSSRVPGAGNVSGSAGKPDGEVSGGAWGKSYQLFSQCQDSVKRQSLMAAALAGITKANWREAWQPMWDSRRQGLISELEWKLFMQRFGAVAGEEVALFGKPADVVKDWEAWNIRFAMEGWAARDAGGSWAWISGLPEGNYRRGLMTGWMEGAAAVDPDRALAALQDFDPEKDSSIWAVAAAKMANQDPEKIKTWLSGQSARPGREGTGWVDGRHDPGISGNEIAETFFNQLLRSKMAINPGDPAYVRNLKAWFDQYSGNPGVPDSAIGQIASALRRDNPPGDVLQWIGTHPASPGTFNSAVSTVSEWTNEGSANEVTAWLQANPENPAYDGAAAGFAVKAFKFDPEGARVWAATIRDRTQRESLLQHLETLKSE